MQPINAPRWQEILMLAFACVSGGCVAIQGLPLPTDWRLLALFAAGFCGAGATTLYRLNPSLGPADAQTTTTIQSTTHVTEPPVVAGK